MQPKWYIIIGSVVTVVFAVFMGCFGLIFTAVMENMLVIDPGNEIYDSFLSPPVPIYLDFYFFNVSNPSDVQHYGAKPILVECGPYKYKETLVKDIVTSNHSAGTISYKQRSLYEFDPLVSNGTEEDVIINLNPVMVIVGALAYDNKKVYRILWPEIENGMDLFEPHTVGELLFQGFELPEFDYDFSDIGCKNCDKTEGLNGTLYEILVLLGVPEDSISFLQPNRFGLLYGVNNTDDGVYTVNTGENGMDEYLYIQTWNGEDHIDYWNDTYCDMINGTDGTQFPPNVRKEDTLRMFVTDLCRSLYLGFAYESKIQGVIDTFHFVPPAAMLESGHTNDDNDCYCIPVPGDNVDPCLDDSMLNMAPCLGAPVVLSTPHFYGGQDIDINAVEGLNPQTDLHETYLDIEPTTGVVVKAAKRIQMNLPLKRYAHLPSFQNVPELIFPVLWAAENAEIGEEDADTMHKALTLPYIIVYVICSLILVTGLALITIGAMKYRRTRASSQAEILLGDK